MNRVLSSVLSAEPDATVPWTQRQMKLGKFGTHMRSEFALHRWGVAGDDDASLELLHQHGIRHSSASVLHNLGYVRHQLGDDRAALPLFREALALFVNQGDHRGIAECLVGLGVCLRLKPRHRRG